jgi:ankyrin repeat protein
MKRVLKYNKFNEGVRDKMTPKSENDIVKSLEKLSPNERLIKGAQYDSLLIVKKSLEDGADIHTSNDKPLRDSCFGDHVEVAKYLIKSGADIHVGKDTCLYHACIHGKINIVKLLLDNGVDPDARDGECIERAVFFNNIDIVKLLINYGADIHRNNEKLLQRAVLNSHGSLVEFLINNGAHMYMVAPMALTYANDTDNYKIPKIVNKYSKKKQYKTNEGVRDLMRPKLPDDVRRTHYNLIFWKLLVSGRMSDELKRITTHYDRSIEVARELGITNEPKTSWQRELMMYLYVLNGVRSSNDELDMELLRLVNSLDKNNEQAALYVGIKNFVNRKYNEVNMDFRRNMGSDIMDESVRDMMTPKPVDDIMQLITKHSEPSTVLVMSAEHGYLDLVKDSYKRMIKNTKYDNRYITYDAIKQACYNGHVDIVEYLLEMIYDKSFVPYLRENSDEMLRETCEKGHTDVVKVLVKYGCDIHSVDEQPLRNAVYHDHIELAKYLLDNGADLHTWKDYCFRYAHSDEMKELLNSYLKTNESVRDMMKPKSKEELRIEIDKMVPGEKLRKGLEFGVLSKEEARDMVDRLSPEFKLAYGRKYGLLSDREVHEIFITLPLIEKIRFMFKTNYRYPSEKLKKEFMTLSPKEKGDIIQFGYYSNLLAQYWVTYVNVSDRTMEEGIDKMLKRLRKVSAKNIWKSKRWGRNVYNVVTNESVRDKMTPKSDEEIRTVIKRIIRSDSDYIEVKIPEPKEPKKIKTLLELSDKYNLDIQDYDDKNIIVCGDITDVFNFIKFYVNYTLINKRNSSDFFIDYIIKNKVGKVTESVRDKMTPKSEEDIKELTNKMTCQEQLYNGCEKNILWLVELGLKKGADIHLDRDYSLREACRLGHFDIVLYLLKHGADVHAVRDNALQLATFEGHYDVVRMLLAFGADVHAEDDLAIHYAEMYWDQNMVNLLNKYRRKKVNENVRDTNGVGLLRSKMTPKSEEDIQQAIQKSLNRYPNLGTFNYKKYGLIITGESDLNENIFRMIDKDNNHWFMQLEFFVPSEGRIYIYAYPPNALKSHSHERFYSYKELEDFLDKIYKK